jgi:hypothetical protein
LAGSGKDLLNFLTQINTLAELVGELLIHQGVLPLFYNPYIMRMVLSK